MEKVSLPICKNCGGYYTERDCPYCARMKEEEQSKRNKVHHQEESIKAPVAESTPLSDSKPTVLQPTKKSSSSSPSVIDWVRKKKKTADTPINTASSPKTLTHGRVSATEQKNVSSLHTPSKGINAKKTTVTPKQKIDFAHLESWLKAKRRSSYQTEVKESPTGNKTTADLDKEYHAKKKPPTKKKVTIHDLKTWIKQRKHSISVESQRSTISSNTISSQKVTASQKNIPISKGTLSPASTSSSVEPQSMVNKAETHQKIPSPSAHELTKIESILETQDPTQTIAEVESDEELEMLMVKALEELQSYQPETEETLSELPPPQSETPSEQLMETLFDEDLAPSMATHPDNPPLQPQSEIEPPKVSQNTPPVIKPPEAEPARPKTSQPAKISQPSTLSISKKIKRVFSLKSKKTAVTATESAYTNANIEAATLKPISHVSSTPMTAPETTKAPFIVLEDVVKIYREKNSENRVLLGVNFTVYENEWIAILGPSGSGKSTLLNLIGGLDRPTAGSIYINGVDITRLSDDDLAKYRLKTMGYVFQFFNLIPELNALENIEFPQILLGKPKKEAKKRSLELLKWVGLSHKAKQRVETLSGGEQQRISICVALANDPQLILMDEPTGNLDPTNTQAMVEIFKYLHEELGKTLIIATHDLEVAAMAEKIYSVVNGRLIPREL